MTEKTERRSEHLRPRGETRAMPSLQAIDALLSQAESNHRTGRTPAALEELREAHRLAPSATLAPFELGNLLLAALQSSSSPLSPSHAEQAKEAEKAFRAALSPPQVVTPSRHLAPVGMAYNNLANLLSLRGRHSEAEELLRTGLSVQPVAYQYNGLANILLRKADGAADGGNRTALLNEAAALLNRAIEHEQRCKGKGPAPMEHAYRENLAHVLSRLEEPEEPAVQGQLAPRPRDWQAGRPLLVMLVQGGSGCEAPKAKAKKASANSDAVAPPKDAVDALFVDDAAQPLDDWPASSTHSCACPAPFGTLQDVASAAASMSSLGYAVEVDGCLPAMDIGLDANGTLWMPSMAYRQHGQSRGPHIVIYVDHFPSSIGASGGGGTVLSRWVWQLSSESSRGDAADVPVDGVLTAPSLEALLAAVDSDEDLLLSGSGESSASQIKSTSAATTTRRIEAVPPLLDPACVAAGRRSGARPSLRFCYTQPPSVGLDSLLNIWPQVHKARPKATLTIFSCPSASSSASCAHAYKTAAGKNNGGGVSVMEGEIVGSELAAALGSCSFDLIPVDEPSTVSLGSLYRAQAAGSIPVSTRHLSSILPIGCGRWDLGPPPSSNSISKSQKLKRDWLASVLAVASRKLKEHRESMKGWAAQLLDAQEGGAAGWHAAFSGSPPPAADESSAASSKPPLPPPQQQEADIGLQRTPWRPPPPEPPPPPPPSSPPLDDEARVASLSAKIAAGGRELKALKEHIASLESELSRCEGGRNEAVTAGVAMEEEEVAEPEEEAVETGSAEADDAPLPPARLCWITMLERPGGLEVAVHAARMQSSKAFRLVLLDRLHERRGNKLRSLVKEKSVSPIASRVSHLPFEDRQWGLRSVFARARPACEEDGSTIETFLLSRQYVWLPSDLIAATIQFHASMARASAGALLGYPVWQFQAPQLEMVAKALDDESTSGVFSPPLTGAFSSRGWRVTKRVHPAPKAALAGGEAIRLDDRNSGALNGVWSLPARLVASMADSPKSLDELIPPTSGTAAERCYGMKKLPLPKGVVTMLANLSLLCESLDTTRWEPPGRWAHDPQIDGGCAS